MLLTGNSGGPFDWIVRDEEPLPTSLRELRHQLEDVYRRIRKHRDTVDMRLASRLEQQIQRMRTVVRTDNSG